MVEIKFPLRAHHLPADDGSCGWFERLPDRGRRGRRLEGSREADCVVVGAGFTGLAIARRLRLVRPEWTVILLDAQRVGTGTSGRCSGFVCDLVDFTAKMNVEDCARHVRVARSGIEELRKLVTDHRIACDWDEKGWIRAASGPAGEKLLGRWPGWAQRWGIPFRHLGRQDLQAVTGSRFYSKGIRFIGAPLVQGAALVRGLASALPEGVELFEDSAVSSIEDNGRYHLRTGAGTVAAERVFLATNAYTPALNTLQRKVFPLYTFGSLTRPLSAGEQELLGGESEWGILATDDMGSTVRRTRDQRILIRNTVHYTKKPNVSNSLLRKVRREHRRAFEARFPALGSVGFDHTWSGLMASSMGYRPVFGELAESFFVAAVYTAAGIAMGTAMGRLLADQAAGVDSDLLRDMSAIPGPRSMPPEPFRSLGARWTMARMNARAGSFL